jgi:hypothetical protein
VTNRSPRPAPVTVSGDRFLARRLGRARVRISEIARREVLNASTVAAGIYLALRAVCIGVRVHLRWLVGAAGLEPTVCWL